MAQKKMEFPTSPYLELRGLDRMVLFAASCISIPNHGSQLKKKPEPVSRSDLAKRVQRECMERNEDAPQADAIQDCVGHLIEKGYVKSNAKKFIRVTPVGEGMIDRPYCTPSLSIDPTPCLLRDAVTKLHGLFREIATNKKAYRWDPHVNPHGQILRRVLIRWAQEIGLSRESLEQALKVVVQCGCINVIPCTISTFVDFLLDWVPVSDSQCKADRLVQLWESSIAESSTETNVSPRDPTMLRQFLYRLVASTEVPLSERATHYPTIETRNVARAWAEKQGWPRFGLLLEDGLAVIQELLGKDEGIARPNLSTPPPKKLMAFAHAQPRHFKNNAEKTLYATEYPYAGPLADAFFELLETDAIRPTELRYVDQKHWCGPVFRVHSASTNGLGLVAGDRETQPLPPTGRQQRLTGNFSTPNALVPLTGREDAVWQYLEGQIYSSETLAVRLGGKVKAQSVPSIIMGIRSKRGPRAILLRRKRGYYRPDKPPS